MVRRTQRVWIVEDEPAAAALAADLCQVNGAAPSLFRFPLPFLTALRTSAPPTAVILDGGSSTSSLRRCSSPRGTAILGCR